MPLLERGYRAAAKTELERRVRELESRDAVAQKKPDMGETATILTNNVEFAQKIKLITDKEAEGYRKRIAEAQRAEELARTQTGDRVDGFTNPHEAALNQYSLEEIKAQVSAEKAQKPTPERGDGEPTQTRTGEELERTPPH